MMTQKQKDLDAALWKMVGTGQRKRLKFYYAQAMRIANQRAKKRVPTRISGVSWLDYQKVAA